MRKMLTTALLMCTVALLATLSMPVVSAQPNKPLKCGLSIWFNWVQFKWFGTVSGDIEGSITWTPGEAIFQGATEHFFETWVIETTDGSVIEGFDEGVYSGKNFKWMSNGRVTAASGRWAYLIGCNMQTMGVTSPFAWGEPLTGTGTMRIYPNSY